MKRKVLFCISLVLIFSLSIVTACEFPSIFGSKLNHKFTPLNQFEYSDGFEIQESTPISNEDARELGYDLSYGTDYEVSYKHIKATASYDDLSSYGMQNEVYYPGALIDINTMDVIQIDRKKMTVSLGLESSVGINPNQLSVNAYPSLDGMRTAIGTLVNTVVTSANQLATAYDIDVNVINSEDEFALNLGVGLSSKVAKKFSLKENFAMNQTTKQTNVAVVLKQIYYTVDVSLPNNVYDFFGNSVTNNQLKTTIGSGIIPTYISSVSYGKVAILSIQTNFSKTEITNKLESNFSLLGGKINIDSAISNIARDSETKIHCFVYGGTSTDINTLLTTAGEFSLNNFFSSVNPQSYKDAYGLPISYKFRHIKGGALAKIQSSNEYDAKTVTYKPKKLVDWTYYDSLIASGELRDLSKLTLDISSTSENANKTIVIPENITELELRGNNDITDTVKFKNLSLNIISRPSPITISLQNITFSGNEQPCISSQSRALLTLNFKGKVELTGASGHPAISAKNLEMCGFGDIKIVGGPGAAAVSLTEDLSIMMDGETLELRGGTGLTGATGTSYSQTTNAISKESNGRNGGTGAKGGLGGAAITARNVVINATNLELILISGNGGTGGAGGTGEFGGASDKTKAGNGGGGGAGGAGGPVLNVSSISGECYSVQLITGNAGKGGKGGDGGHSDKVGFWGNVGGNPGYGGAGGTGGSPGTLGIELSILSQLSETLDIIYGTANTAGENGTKGKENK